MKDIHQRMSTGECSHRGCEIDVHTYDVHTVDVCDIYIYLYIYTYHSYGGC